jgi:hypothetical protein
MRILDMTFRGHSTNLSHFGLGRITTISITKLLLITSRQVSDGGIGLLEQIRDTEHSGRDKLLRHMRGKLLVLR